MRPIRVLPIPRAPRPRRFRRLLSLPVRYWQWTLWGAVGLLGLAAVAVALLPQLEPSRIKDTEIGVQAVRGATTMFLAEHRKSLCPSLKSLIAGGFLDEDKSTTDHWGGEFRIECSGTRITVTSAGPDQTFDTADDIR